MDKNTKETLLGIDLYKNLSREELILGLLASTAREDEMKPRKVFVEATEMEKSMIFYGHLVRIFMGIIILIFWCPQNLE